MARLELSDIARSISGRIREVEDQLKDHKALSDELERLRGALSRLEGGVRARVDGRGRRQRPVTQRTTAPAPKDTSPARSTNARAPRGENKQKILAALNGGPKTASEIATRNGDQGGHRRRVAEQAGEGRRGGEGRPGLRAPRSKHQRSEVSMAFEVGKRVVAESESTSRRPRAGVVEEVLRGDPSPRYRIRWDDGHESIYTPASGALRAEPRPKRQRQSTPRKR